ncbi:MAG TPA: 2-dehydro-3-deoxy-D-gluconate 5-dehydrogenase KduD [Thermoanaerobaculia bacterium]|jgi:2-deoxy-D-gluconate 3-dehydrogenase|nr:2-dehydro-3-deoxy-D-gluconate 5-dehydrogenase KduD [Thermoanaerobaculia bacterium]
MFSLAGYTAIVTGASRGLGAAMAIALAEAGADVAIVARGDLSETESAIRNLGRRAFPVQADLADRTAADTIMRAVPIADILVNNAGIIRRADALDYSDEDWDTVIDVNLRSVFTLSRAFARALVARNGGGRIINIASLLSFQGGIRVPAYTAAKSGLLGLTRALANELAPKGINVNAIAPGYMETDNTQALRDDPVRSRDILARIPAARWGTPDDLKGAVVFLASNASAYVHGTTIAVDGGWLSR